MKRPTIRPISETPSSSNGSETILILSPTGRDAPLAGSVLSDAGLKTRICTDLDDLCAQLRTGYNVGVILIAEEAFLLGQEHSLIELLETQPRWSDLPIILLTSAEASRYSTLRAMDIFGATGNVTLLERPLQAVTLISAIQVGLRNRRRQYEIRDLLEQREDALETLTAAREEAESANKMKDQFLATLSHELRTPLNAILGWVQILREELAGDRRDVETLRQGVEVIERNAKMQAQLIEDLLDVSRIISGKLILDHKPVDIAQVVMSARDAITPQAEAKGVSLEVTIASPLPPVLGDAARLQQIIWNLLSNAVKFTPSEGTISLNVRRSEADVQLVICDTGQGMSSEFLPFVFERFRQADSSTTRKQGGLGLGLSIVRQLVELHKGTVTAESGGLGKGSSFTLTLPAAVAPVNGSADKTSVNGLSSPGGSSGVEKKLDGVRVLVVDNEPDARDLIKRLLVEAHAEVDVASSVAEALMIVKQHQPDILISDIGMPGEDGYDLIRKIRASPDGISKIPAVALTAFASMEDRARAKLAGFQLHLAKPVDPNELRRMVASLA